jgi:GT2 family glycosyltransferase
MTRASLIVLNYNGLGVIERCLESLRGAMGSDDELIVVDNASTDGSRELSRAFCAGAARRQFIGRTVNNYIFGLNDGLKVATGRYVGFFNNDNVFESTSISRMVAQFDSERVFAVAPRVTRDADGRDQGTLTTGHWRRGLIFFDPQPHDDGARHTFFAVGGQSLFDRAKLLELGSIDELLYPMYHEDIELAWRAWKRGYEIRYAPDAIVRHIGGHSSQRVFTPAQLRSFVRQNELLIVWKNVTDWKLLITHACLLPARLVVAGMRCDWPTIRGFGSAVRRLPRVRQARRRARQTARLSDREVLTRVSEIGLGLGASADVGSGPRACRDDG